MHLVDSPGHVDFSGEVEAALRVCDGAILVVDVVEGVCVQTVTVLRAALQHAVEPVLVLNKIDRLFGELGLTPMEAYRHIQMVIEQVNVIMGVREVELMMEEATLGDTDWTLDESVTKAVANESGFFSPELGNVAFASAIHGWAFRISDFAKIFSKRFGISERVLQRTLWGDYYLQLKARRIVRRKASDTSAKAEPMFSKFIMSTIHAVYDGVLSTQNDPELAYEKRVKFSEKLGLKLSKRDLRHRDIEVVLNAIMGTWLPAASTLLDMVADKLPTAAQAQANPKRLTVMWPHISEPSSSGESTGGSDNGAVHRKEAFARQHHALKNCLSEDNTPVLAVVTKMIEGPSPDAAMSSKISLPKPREELSSDPKPEKGKTVKREAAKTDRKMIAFARVFSGSISVGSKLYAYGPKYKVADDGTFDDATVAEVTVTNLYLLMGRSADSLQSVSAGSIVGIGGLEDVVIKTATVSSEPPGQCLPAGLSLSHTGLQRDAVVRVAVEPHLPGQLPILETGLRKLNQSDPSVETSVTSAGEYIVAASGELHLERCLKDLRETFTTGIQIHVSKPLVSFRETVIGGSSLHVDDEDEKKSLDSSDEKKNEGDDYLESDPYLQIPTIQSGKGVIVSNSIFSFRVFAAPIPTHLSNALEEARKVVQSISNTRNFDKSICVNVREKLIAALKKDVEDFKSENVPSSELERCWLESILPHVWSCGPKRFGSNLLVGPYPSPILSEPLRYIFNDNAQPENRAVESSRRMRELESAIATGFQLGVQAGPLAEEPMHGVAVFVRDLVFKNEASELMEPSNESNSSEGTENTPGKTLSASVSGLGIGAMREGTRRALLHGNARIMEAVLNLDISVSGEALGGTYTVIGKRRGRVLSEQVRDGVNIFGIEALIPVEESFGFANALRKKTSGSAVPQMVFSHWETIELDPFWEPKTEEELEELGASDATAEKNNLAKKLINSVRRRKGIKVDEKIVENAEKQRTLSRKK